MKRVLGFLFVVWLATVPFALTPDQVTKLKEAGVDDRTIRMLIELETRRQEGSEGMGVIEVPRPGGGKEKVYYSGATSEEELRLQEEEREKLERAWEILKRIIVDERKK